MLDSKKKRAPQSTHVVSPSDTMRIDSSVTSDINTYSGPHSGKQETNTAGKLKQKNIYSISIYIKNDDELGVWKYDFINFKCFLDNYTTLLAVI